MRKKIIRDLLKASKLLFESGVVDYFAGNLSVFWKDKIFITRSGSPLPLLQPQDIIVVEKNKPLVGKPSSEFIVHKAVYEKTNHKAVAHAHPPTLVKLAFNLSGDYYIPKDNEGKLLLGKVPMVRVSKPSGSPELAEVVSETLKTCPCVIVYSHGIFCGAENILKAAGLITALESSAKVSF
jgi:L-fuculose-phosphate aldolase